MWAQVGIISMRKTVKSCTTSNIGVSIISLHDTPRLHTLKRVIRIFFIRRTYNEQGWGQVQLTKYSSTPSTPNIYQVQVLVKYSFFKKVLRSGMGFFRFLTEIRFFLEPFGSFLRSMQIRFNNFFRGGGGGGHATLQQIYGLSILPLCDFYWLISTLNIAICDASLLLSPMISIADVYQVLETCSDMPV